MILDKFNYVFMGQMLRLKIVCVIISDTFFDFALQNKKEVYMLVWNKPQLGDREWISKCVEEAGYMGSDAAFASIYLLQSKYNIRVAFYKDCLIRYYEGHNSRHGYTFPLGAGNIDKALEGYKTGYHR